MDASLIRWGRVRDDTSDAQVNTRSTQCARLVKPENVMRYELVIERDGIRQWEGVITYMTTKAGFTTIKAKDITYYLNRTALTRPWHANGQVVYCVDRIRSIIEYECAEKEAMGYRIIEGMQVLEHPEGARTTRSTERYEKYVFEELDDMAWRAGIDYTVIRRKLLINDTDHNLGEIRSLSQKDFDGAFSLTTYGAEMATDSVVADGFGTFGRYAGEDGDGIDPYYGQIVLVHTEYSEDDDRSDEPTSTPVEQLNSQAYRNYVGRNRPYTVINVSENSRLNGRTADELMEYLFPGVRTRVVLDDPDMPPMSQMMRLSDMSVEETSDGEDVKVTFTTGALDEDMVV